MFVTTREKQREKLARCLQKENGTSASQKKEKKRNWVVNVSAHTLTTDEQAILEKGLNFAIGPKKVPQVEIIAAIEPTLKEEVDQTRAESA